MMHDLLLHICEERDAANYELRIHVKSCIIRQETEHTASVKGGEPPPVLSHASLQTADIHCSFRFCDGNASLQLRWHRYRDRATLIMRLELSSNTWNVSGSSTRDMPKRD